MFTKRKHNLQCLWLLFLTCFIVVIVVIVFLQVPSHIELVVDVEIKGEIYDFKHLFNIQEFNYVVNSAPCSNNSLGVLIVTSYAGDVEARSAQRRAYPQSLLRRLGLHRIFLLALINPEHNTNRIHQAAIANENERFKDIVQGNFLEHYRNLTYKHIMGLGWAAKFCEHIPYIIKMDHDIVVDLFSITEMLRKLPERKHILAGYVMINMSPIREPASKWFVTKEEYAQNRYPDFLSGWMYITNPRTARQLHQEALHIPYFWIDDIYVTGLLAEKLNLPLVKLNTYYTTHPEHLQCCINQPNLLCDFWVGPNGGDTKLIYDFKKFAQTCNIYKCSRRQYDYFVRKNCSVL